MLNLGVLPHAVIGDLDSVDKDTLLKLTSSEVNIERYSEDKDETDFELALGYAVAQQPTEILIVGALGGRLDQTLANLSLLTDPRLPDIDIRMDDGVEKAFFCRTTSEKGKQVKFEGRSGDTISLIPWQNQVEGVETKGLKWPLYGETLFPEKSRGLSNVMLESTASVSIRSGTLLILQHRPKNSN